VKRKGFLQYLGVGVVLALVVSVFLSSPAFAAARVTLNPSEGMVGDSIVVSGRGFPPYDPGPPAVGSFVDVYFTSVTTASVDPKVGNNIDSQVKTYRLLDNSVEVDVNGEFNTSIKVLNSLKDGDTDMNEVRGGTYYVCVTMADEVDIKAVATFTITAGELDPLDPKTGPVGTEVAITGANFAASESITVKYDDNDITDAVVGDASSDRRGDIDFSIVIPPSTAGAHTIAVSDETLSDATTTFTVEPTITVTPGSAPPKKTTSVSGTGFGSKKEVEVRLNDTPVATKTTDSKGSLTATTFTVPDINEGTYDLVASDGTNEAKTDFVVEVGTEITVSPETSASSPGHAGQSVTISGVAFTPNATVTITYASQPQVMGTTPTNANGDFSFTFKVPKSPAGAHAISASDGANTLQTSFYMEANPPATPQLLLPEVDMKAPSVPKFDWGDVSDDSGVTYTLQVATSETFAANTIVLEKKGLTASDYNLTKDEALKSRSAKEPYYWRVMAIDGAGNDGDWTATDDFWVGISLPRWTVHLFWGLGVIGAIFLGYYLARRRSYY
jgi:hypothetical protein